jgi:ubiquinol-cytochrome c reductase iron-sulfur subunit
VNTVKNLSLFLAGMFYWLRGKRRDAAEAIESDNHAPSPSRETRRAENAVLLLLGGTAISAIAFVIVYALDRLPDQTQFLGLSIGLAFVCLAAAFGVVGMRLVVDEEAEEDYPPIEHTAEVAEIEELVEKSGVLLTRRKLLVVAGAGTAGALGAALITPFVSLGPAFDLAQFVATPWYRGRRLVGENGRPLAEKEIEEAAFYTAYPEGANREQLAAPLVVVRVPSSDLKLPASREGWAPGGIVAYSKICTHAACAISLYRVPTFAPLEPKPALVCPCHYSTFDPGTGGTVLFGPAGRPLPQLPLEVDHEGYLRAGGTFSGPVGPSWWDVRARKATG